MATVKFVVKKKSTRKDGTTPIYLQYSYNPEKRVLINTGCKIEPKFWNFANDTIRKSQNEYDSINRKINDQKRRIEEIISKAFGDGINPTIEYIIENFKNPRKENRKDQKAFLQYLDDFIESSKGRVVDGVIKDYESMSFS